MTTFKRVSGFTVIELLIAVTIIGILAAIAYPQYTRYVAETRRSDAQVALQSVAVLQEKFFTVCSRYATNIGGAFPRDLADCAGAGVGLGASGGSPQGYYAVGIADPLPALPVPPAGCTPATCYVLTATPVGPQATLDGIKCSALRLTHAGVKWAAGSEAGKCWKK